MTPLPREREGKNRALATRGWGFLCDFVRV